MALYACTYTICSLSTLLPLNPEVLNIHRLLQTLTRDFPVVDRSIKTIFLKITIK